MNALTAHREKNCSILRKEQRIAMHPGRLRRLRDVTSVDAKGMDMSANIGDPQEKIRHNDLKN